MVSPFLKDTLLSFFHARCYSCSTSLTYPVFWFLDIFFSYNSQHRHNLKSFHHLPARYKELVNYTWSIICFMSISTYRYHGSKLMMKILVGQLILERYSIYLKSSSYLQFWVIIGCLMLMILKISMKHLITLDSNKPWLLKCRLWTQWHLFGSSTTWEEGNEAQTGLQH